ncbi:MAG: hypothetical protein JKY26_01685 [Pseudomonas sp.]|nr:hypothetical protein [Pseudomonas sp.]
MSIITQTLAIICPEVTVTGESSEFTEAVYDALTITPENYRPCWDMVEVSAQEEGFLSGTANVNDHITVGSLWDRFLLEERNFIRHSANPLLPRDESSTFPAYNYIIDDIKDSLNLYGFIDVSRPDFAAGIGYICNCLLAEGLISDVNQRINELLIEGTETERYKGEG